MKNHRSIMIGLMYHQIAHTIIFASALVVFFFFQDWLAALLNISFVQVEREPVVGLQFLWAVIQVSWIGGYWLAWLLVKRNRIWCGIVLGLIVTALPAFGSLSVLAMLADDSFWGMGIESIGWVGLTIFAAVFFGGLFVHYLALLIMHWAAKAEVSQYSAG